MFFQHVDLVILLGAITLLRAVALQGSKNRTASPAEPHSQPCHGDHHHSCEESGEQDEQDPDRVQGFVQGIGLGVIGQHPPRTHEQTTQKHEVDKETTRTQEVVHLSPPPPHNAVCVDLLNYTEKLDKLKLVNVTNAVQVDLAHDTVDRLASTSQASLSQVVREFLFVDTPIAIRVNLVKHLLENAHRDAPVACAFADPKHQPI
mmetsp:Transcript_20576/g.48122  ORF Transcript_20576/g.48122 Transcript_20576/m.48122 type:complete len:204 (-) Transcript_20576:802-1413(-)